MQAAAILDFSQTALPPLERVHDEVTARLPGVERLGPPNEEGLTYQLGRDITSVTVDSARCRIIVLVSYPETRLETTLVEVIEQLGGAPWDWSRDT